MVNSAVAVAVADVAAIGSVVPQSAWVWVALSTTVVVTWILLAKYLHPILGRAWATGVSICGFSLCLWVYGVHGTPELPSFPADERREEAAWFAAAQAMGHNDEQVRKVAAKALIRLVQESKPNTEPTGKLRMDRRMAAGWFLLSRAHGELGDTIAAEESFARFKIFFDHHGKKLLPSLVIPNDVSALRVP